MIINISLDSTEPIYEQLRNQVVLGIATKSLSPGESLPSVRQLASEIGINMHTVNKAYKLLEQEDWIIINRKKGAFIHPDVNTRNKNIHPEKKEKLTILLAELHLHGLKRNDILKMINTIMNTFEEE